MAWREAGGMWKFFVSWVFIELPCWTEKVCIWARMVLKTMVQAKIGITDSSIFTCWTCATVHSLHGLSFTLFPSWILMQALSKNLYLLRVIRNIIWTIQKWQKSLRKYAKSLNYSKYQKEKKGTITKTKCMKMGSSNTRFGWRGQTQTNWRNGTWKNLLEFRRGNTSNQHIILAPMKHMWAPLLSLKNCSHKNLNRSPILITSAITQQIKMVELRQ